MYREPEPEPEPWRVSGVQVFASVDVECDRLKSLEKRRIERSCGSGDNWPCPYRAWLSMAGWLTGWLAGELLGGSFIVSRLFSRCVLLSFSW